MLKSRTRYAVKNRANSRSFTSLSETISLCMRSLWIEATALLSTETELALDFMRTVCKYNCLGGFLDEAELLDLLERVCWDRLEVFPRASMQIACNAAQSLRSVKGALFIDNGLALRYISASSKESGLDLIGPFFALLDADDEEVWLTSLSLLAPHIGEEALLVSYCKIIEIVMETFINDMLLKSLWNIHLLPYLVKISELSSDAVNFLLKNIVLLIDKFDYGPSHQTIIDALRTTSEEKILAQVYQIVGVFASPNYSFSISDALLSALCEFIVEGKNHPKRIWAAANLVSNPKAIFSYQHLVALSDLSISGIASSDEIELTSAIRCDLEISLLRDTVEEYIARIEGLLDGLSSPKVLWTCANSIKRIADKGHLIEPCVITRLIKILELTPYYKVAISVVQCLSAIKRNNANWDESHTDRIRSSLSGQRFTITDSYSEKYHLSLRSSNAELLSLLDNLHI